mgnify:CR=1 FL=1
MRTSMTIVCVAAAGLAAALAGRAALTDAGRGLGAMFTGGSIEIAISSALAAQHGRSEGELLLTAFEPAAGDGKGEIAQVVCQTGDEAARTVVSGPF